MAANFDEIALSRTVKEIEANLCLPFLAKIRKFKMAAIFGEGKILPRVQCSDTLKILTKSLYLAQICVLPFLAKIRKFKMAAIFGGSKIYPVGRRNRSIWHG